MRVWRIPAPSFLFHGAGSANLGTAALLRDEAGVPASSIFVTNSRGVRAALPMVLRAR